MKFNFSPYLIETKLLKRVGLSGESIDIETFVLKIDRSLLKRSDSSMAGTYQNKPLLNVDKLALYGELAILQLIKRDGWSGVWVDSFHSKSGPIKLWSDMPPLGAANLNGESKKVFEAIIEANGKMLGGFFDIFAWRGDEFVFIEYKGPKDKPNANEQKWIKAALKVGIKPSQLFFVQIKN